MIEPNNKSGDVQLNTPTATINNVGNVQLTDPNIYHPEGTWQITQ